VAQKLKRTFLEEQEARHGKIFCSMLYHVSGVMGRRPRLLVRPKRVKKARPSRRTRRQRGGNLDLGGKERAKRTRESQRGKGNSGSAEVRRETSEGGEPKSRKNLERRDQKASRRGGNVNKEEPTENTKKTARDGGKHEKRGNRAGMARDFRPTTSKWGGLFPSQKWVLRNAGKTGDSPSGAEGTQ